MITKLIYHSRYISLFFLSFKILTHKHRRLVVISAVIEAPRDFCIRPTVKQMGVTEEVAAATIRQTDKFRAEYYAYYTHGNYRTKDKVYRLYEKAL